MRSSRIMPGSDGVKVAKVILCCKKRRGRGVPIDRIRIVEEVFDLQGNLIAENDPDMIYTQEDMIHFAVWFHNQKDPVLHEVAIEEWKKSLKI